ncbi:hypothetical protein OY671_008721, partial [Metschnikowia pulcherrima]
DYPMTAPGYSERRRESAKSIGSGRKRVAKAKAAAPAAPVAPKKRAPRKSTKAPR